MKTMTMSWCHIWNKKVEEDITMDNICYVSFIEQFYTGILNLHEDHNKRLAFIQRL